MRHSYNIQDGSVVALEEGIGSILVFVNPDKDEQMYLTDNFGLDEHTLSSALDLMSCRVLSLKKIIVH
jgi:hypothetical protein